MTLSAQPDSQSRAVITITLREWDELKDLRQAIRLERAEVERLQHRIDTADAYIAHLREGNNRHGECRVKISPGGYACGEMLAYEAARDAETNAS